MVLALALVEAASCKRFCTLLVMTVQQPLLRQSLLRVASMKMHNRRNMLVIWSALDVSCGCNDSLAASDAAFRKFYGGGGADAIADAKAIVPLVRLVMSLPPSGASVERAFSCSGRINAPLRNRLSDEMIEALTVVQFYATNKCKSVDSAKMFVARVVQTLDKLKKV